MVVRMFDVLLTCFVFVLNVGNVASLDDGVSCSKNEFRCRYGNCIPIGWKCDGMADCRHGDTSDEQNCPSKDMCDSDPWNHFRCTVTRRCLPLKLVCNGDHDCLYSDFSDEDECTGDFNRLNSIQYKFYKDSKIDFFHSTMKKMR